MTEQSIILVGGPDSGKTNFVARLWKALQSRTGVLIAPVVPSDIKYVEDALEHLLKGDFAPRSDKNYHEQVQSFSVPVAPRDTTSTHRPIQIDVPDVTGELWKKAVETCELPSHWMDRFRGAFGALLFVRIGSDQNNEPMDWVTSAELLSFTSENTGVPELRETEIQTQVSLCELLRFMEHGLGADTAEKRPRVAVLVTAWDQLDAERASQGPSAYLSVEYPLFAGRLSDISELEVKAFGVSVVGGDFVDPEFKAQFLQSDFATSGYVVHEVDGRVERLHDLTFPVAWIVEGISRNGQ